MPYTKLSEAPASLRGIEPPITLAQANGIARCADALEDEGEIESPWAVCIASFKKSHIVKGDKWIKRGEGKSMDTIEVEGVEVALNDLVMAYKADKSFSLDERGRQIRDAWRAQFRKPSTPAAVVEDWWVKEVFDNQVIIEASDGLYAYPYTLSSEGEVEFGEPTKVEVSYQPVGKSASLAVKMLPIKVLNETAEAWIVGGYGMVWGNEQERDLAPWQNKDGTRGEFFTPQTDGLSDIPIKVMTFEHDKETDDDDRPIKETVGTTILERNDSRGRWIEAQLQKQRRYAQYVVDLMNEGDIYLSSDTAQHWREVAANGEIKRWRTAGYTFTTHPMEPRIGTIDQVKAAYKAAGLDLPPLAEGGDALGDACPDADAMAKAKAAIEISLAEIELLEV